MYYTYILYTEEHNRYYIGQTNDIAKRLKRHNKGYVKSTKSYRPWELVHLEKFPERRKAINREVYLKSLKSKIAIKRLIDTSR